jgi:hypothetical protein
VASFDHAPRTNAKRIHAKRTQRRWLRLLALSVAIFLGRQASAQISSHLIDIIDAAAAESHTDVTILFTCTMRYVAYTPAQAGTETQIRFRPGPDCGLGPLFSGISELPSVAGTEGLLTSARLEDGAPGEINLDLQWRKLTTYVAAPTGNQRGFVIRVLEAKVKGEVFIQETLQPSLTFAVNLDARTTAFTEAEVRDAGSKFNMPAYVSTIDLDGVAWYRLRIGPCVSRSDAEHLLGKAQRLFPRAWLVIGEESIPGQSESSAPVPAAAAAASDPPLEDSERAKLLADAKTAMQQRKFSAAIESLTRLVRQPEFPDRAEAQELLGLARERSGQLAHAKAEYLEYLARYPSGAAADRIKLRLKTLALAGRKPAFSPLSGRVANPLGWSSTGGVAQLYRWDSNSVTSAGQTFNQTSQNALLSYGDILVRRRGERFDFLTRVYAGYTETLVHNFGGNQAQVNSAFVELTDTRWDVTGRFGRQTRGSDGVFGTFDGGWVAYRVTPGVTLNATFGYPVDTVSEGPQPQRDFVGVAADFGTLWRSLDVSTYALEQKFNGQVDRRAVGLEARFFRPGQSLIGLIDYDTFYKSINEVTVIGNLSLPANWLLSMDVDRRNSPILTTRNALIGQPVTTLDELTTTFTPDQILQLARDRTAVSSLYSITVSRPLGERFQLSMDVYSTNTGATPASGNVPASPASGADRAAQLQLFGTSLWKRSDLHVLYLRYDKNQLSNTESIGLSSRLPIWGQWRIGPRLRVDRITYTVDDSKETALSPSLRLERLQAHLLLEFEAGSGLNSRNTPLDTQKTKSYYVSAGYRWGF